MSYLITGLIILLVISLFYALADVVTGLIGVLVVGALLAGAVALKGGWEDAKHSPDGVRAEEVVDASGRHLESGDIWPKVQAYGNRVLDLLKDLKKDLFEAFFEDPRVDLDFEIPDLPTPSPTPAPTPSLQP